MYGGVPISFPVSVRRSLSAGREIPKSITRTPSGGHQYVAGLQVPVHDPRPVDVAQRLRQPGGEPRQLRGVQHPLPYPLGERRGVDEQGRHPRPLRIRIGVHDGRGERSAHPPRGRDLLPEPRPEFRIHRVLGMHDLDGEFQPRP
ncbi:hypothetical protein GCM10020254_39030 [Streptomyces goshikiensis]